MSIRYELNARLTPELFVQVLNESGLGARRPVNDRERMAKMVEHGNLTMVAWDGDRPVGVARGLTDFVYCCYLSDLAISEEYQKQGIGREMLRQLKEHLGDQVTLLLLAAPAAKDYYSHIGFDKVENGWILNRAG